MVGVTVQCRLGNQLFQYAFIKALAERLDTTFFLNEKFERFVVTDYFDLAGHNLLKLKFNKIVFKLVNSPFRKLQSRMIGDYHTGLLEDMGDKEIYNGYFQSPHFFPNIVENLPSCISVKKIHEKQFRLKYEQLFTGQPIIAIHVRRGDYLNLGDWWLSHLGSNDLSLPETYYRKCLQEINDIEKYKIIFVSDDIPYARKMFSDIPNAEFHENDMIIDFQIIMNAEICIVSNSSFAWWAASLNQLTNKQVFCPKYWLGFYINTEYPQAIIPDTWKRIAVN